MVVCDVSGASSEFKILKPVVVLDLVEVVDVLVGSESAAKMALHDEAMLKDVDASSGELYVAVGADLSGDVAVAAAARAEAHHPSGGSARLDCELSSARFAGESDSHISAASRWWMRDSSCPKGTVFKGFRACTIGSIAGLRAVPQPCHWRAASVAGAVMS
jgi:hypothetical protein